MNWLLIAFVFDVSTDGSHGEPKLLYKAFPTEQACNAVGANFREVLAVPEAAESISVCIDKAAFHAGDWKTLGTAPAPIRTIG